MKQLVRQYAVYIIAAGIGFVAVPLFYYVNAGDILVSHLWKLLFVGGVGTILVMAWLLRNDFPHRKTWVAAETVLIVLMLPLVYGSGTLLYEAHNAWKGEDAHWHADFKVIVDGEEHELLSSDRFCGNDHLCRMANHTGTSKLHAHDDQRVHIHGPIFEQEDATLAAFFDAFGGTLSADELRYPTNDGWINRTDTDEKSVKVLVNHGSWNNRSWTLLDTPGDYIISPYAKGPIDKLFIIYDNTSADDALADVRDDNTYNNITLP